MEQRISLITLGARDVDGLARFYRAIGWEVTEAEGGIQVFDLIGQSIGIYAIEKLAEDMGVPVDSLGHGAMTLGHNVREKAQVDDVLARAEEAGAAILKPAGEVFWGGYHGYFADPEGHVWEVAFNPFSKLRPDDGAFRWGGYG